MMATSRNVRLAIFLNVALAVVFLVAAVVVVVAVNDSMRRQALVEAQAKARLILDRNLATHVYFSHIMKPRIFAWSERFRSKEYFDPAWMSSTYAIREIDKYFKSISPAKYYFKDAAINARSPENEADRYERAFLEKLGADKRLEAETSVREIEGKPYLVVLRKGEVMDASCLRCHSDPQAAPDGLLAYYGPARSFHRRAGEQVSAVSLRIPLADAYAAANIFSLKLSAILLAVLACLFAVQLWFYRRYLLVPLQVLKEKAAQIVLDEGHLGERIARPFGRELHDLASAFNEMSVKLRHDRDHLEELVGRRTEDLQKSERRYRSLFENMLNGFAYCRMLYDDQERPVDFVYLDVNTAFEQLTGLKDVVGRQITAVIPEIRALTPDLFGIYSRVALTGQPERFDYDFKPLSKWLAISVYSPERGYFVAVFDDITERKRYEENMAYFATHDALTGLMNRRALEEVLGRTVARARRGRHSSLLYTDLDNFKDVNDTVGHGAGDEVLIALAGLLKAELRTEDAVFRLGGDEFAVLLDGIDGGEAQNIAERIRKTVESHLFAAERRVFPLTLSIGLVAIDGAMATGELLSRADTAMYRAKSQGKNRIAM